MSDKMWDGAAYGRIADVTSELDRGVDINVADGAGWTTLLIAGKEGFAEIAMLALDRGADVKAVKKGGFNILHMIAQGLGASPSRSSMDAFVAVFARAVELGAEVDGATSGGQTALYMATAFGQAPLVKILLDAGADASIAASNGDTSLYNAASNADAHVVRALMAAGADVNQRNQAGFGPLHGAARSGNVDVCKILVDAGADPSHQTSAAAEGLAAGTTPHGAAVHDNKSTTADYLANL